MGLYSAVAMGDVGCQTTDFLYFQFPSLIPLSLVLMNLGYLFNDNQHYQICDMIFFHDCYHGNDDFIKD